MMDTFLTALMHAVQNKDLEHAKSLIHKGADVNETLTDGFTALMSATLCGKSQCMELLLETGADVNTTKLDGTIALVHVASASLAAWYLSYKQELM